MSIDLSFHNITTLSAVAKIERRNQYVDLTITPNQGAPTEITIHFDSKAKARRFASAINYAASEFGKHFDIAAAGDAVREEAAKIIQSWRDNPPAQRPASHTDAFGDQQDYDDERAHGWALEGCHDA